MSFSVRLSWGSACHSTVPLEDIRNWCDHQLEHEVWPKNSALKNPINILWPWFPPNYRTKWPCWISTR